ncbi:MAG: alcohol dehydrogenase catalytic domain-containing protein, partial [Mycobacterium sp.]
MHAVEVAATGGPEVLSYVDRPQPSPATGEVLIRTEAVGVNYLDTYFRSGIYPAELPFVVGSEAAGTVAQVGAGVTTLGVGDRVVTAAATGAYAQYCTAPASLVAPIPTGVDSDVAAAALLKGMTAHYLIKSVYPVQRGDTVLLHAGAGGVGLLLTQWATALGARVITTVSTAAKAELSRRAGAVEVLDYPGLGETAAAAFGARIRELTDGDGVAAVYDGVGA